MNKAGPHKIISEATDWRFINQLKKEPRRDGATESPRQLLAGLILNL